MDGGRAADALLADVVSTASLPVRQAMVVNSSAGCSPRDFGRTCIWENCSSVSCMWTFGV